MSSDVDSISTFTGAVAFTSVSASIFGAETGVVIVLQERLLYPSCLQIEHFILDVSSVLLVLDDSFLLDSIFLVVKCRFEMFVGLKGRMVRFAKAVISVVPIEGTDTSVTPLPADVELANMVSTNIPVNTSDRTVTTVDEQNNSTLTIRNTDLVESPPPRWQ